MVMGLIQGTSISPELQPVFQIQGARGAMKHEEEEG